MVIKALCTGVSMRRLRCFFQSGELGSSLSARKEEKKELEILVEETLQNSFKLAPHTTVKILLSHECMNN